jgi:hypothetical protein
VLLGFGDAMLPGGGGAGEVEVFVARGAGVVVFDDEVGAFDVDVAELHGWAQELQVTADAHTAVSGRIWYGRMVVGGR